MAISGSLKDVSVADVMQFIHLGRRTGTLLLQRGAQRALIGFHGGRLVSAQAPRTPKLGDLLMSSGRINRATLERAVQSQAAERERRSLGQLLVASGAIDAESLRQVIGQQIEQAVSEVMVWDSGSFEFAIDDLRPIDDIALYPSDVLPDNADINTQMVLLEAARIFDERNRARVESEPAPPAGASRGSAPGTGFAAGDSTHPALEQLAGGAGIMLLRERTPQRSWPARPARPRSARAWPAGDAPKHAAERLHLQIVSPDRPFADRMRKALGRAVAGVEQVTLLQAGGAAPGEPPPIVIVDLRQGGVSLEEAAALRRARPKASLIALVDPAPSYAKIYEAGVLTALPAEVAAVAACLENLIASRTDLLHLLQTSQGGPGLAGARAPQGVARLRRVFGDLRSGLISATVALNLMHIISESVERAVLFLVKRHQLVALGAFGADARGRPLAELTRGIKLDAHGGNVFSRGLEAGEVQSVSFEEAGLPVPFRDHVGRSRTGQVVVFPVLGAQRVIAVIYADNGDRDEPIEDIDILELATAQVGMAFENELLRRQMSQSKDE
ncbi:MAG TPA: DUF4388 domain-containing protein [Thermoanaerobaculia bacterium]|nr:DUF4388 domain-containing protein [Thermoanaerobaculia bacterium]